MKLKISGIPKLCWADKIKLEFQGLLKAKKIKKAKRLNVAEV